MQVTVSYRARLDEFVRATALARLYCFELVKREDVDWEQPVLQVNRSGLRLKTSRREYGWHPGLLHTRFEAGWKHPLVRALGLVVGDHVLDCTLGLGTDAAFLASLTEVTVLGLEIHPALALITAEGLREAGHDVSVIHADARIFLQQLADDSFDVIQGDPMFPRGTGRNHSLEMIRQVGHYEPLGQEWLLHARRVAKKRVVVRDIAKGQLLEEMQPDEIMEVGKNRPRYGIWFT